MRNLTAPEIDTLRNFHRTVTDLLITMSVQAAYPSDSGNEKIAVAQQEYMRLMGLHKTYFPNVETAPDGEYAVSMIVSQPNE